jgi:hypothetical protein
MRPHTRRERLGASGGATAQDVVQVQHGGQHEKVQRQHEYVQSFMYVYAREGAESS